MIDTHTHLYLPVFESDSGSDATVRRAIDAGVDKMIFPNVDADTIEPMRRLSSRFAQNIRCAIGLHPTEVRENWEDTLTEVLNAYDKKDVAIGEIGIDLYWDKTFREEQMKVFDRQCSFAREHDLPVIIHCREGLDEVLEILKGYKNVHAVFHSFGGSVDDVEKIRKHGDYYFGINGIVTFKNSGLKDVLPCIGINRILLETDSPYLAPVPNRGKRNESSYLPYIAAYIAQYLDIPTSEVDTVTSDNALTLFPKLAD